MLDDFLVGTDLAMSRNGLAVAQVNRVRVLMLSFVQAWERLYASSDKAVGRATLSVHHLLHVAEQILMLGSIRGSSQATCERHIGILKKGLSTFRFPYGAMAHRCVLRTQVTLSRIRLGMDLAQPPPDPPKLMLSFRIGHHHQRVGDSQRGRLDELLADVAPSRSKVVAYGVFSTERGERFQGAGSDRHVGRISQFLAVFTEDEMEAYAFFERFETEETSRSMDVGRWTGAWDLIRADCILEVVAALHIEEAVYICSRSSVQDQGELGEEADDDDVES
ncbi:unnamed protein product [Tilletia controversa]|nr:unnamed protein product [Tilletia controversa]